MEKLPVLSGSFIVEMLDVLRFVRAVTACRLTVPAHFSPAVSYPYICRYIDLFRMQSHFFIQRMLTARRLLTVAFIGLVRNDMPLGFII